jgi:hypothetical protein
MERGGRQSRKDKIQQRRNQTRQQAQDSVSRRDFLKAIAPLSWVPEVVHAVQGKQKVNGYVTKKGTYVAPHYQTVPNKTKIDNFSTKGNTNPFTGKKEPLILSSFRKRSR